MAKRILVLSNTSFSIRKFRLELIHALKAEGYVVILSLPEEDDALRKTLDVQIEGVPYAGRSKNLWHDLVLVVRFIRLFKRINPDLILSFTIKPNIYGSFASRFTGHKQLCTITGTGHSFNQKNVLYRIVRTLYRMAFAHHDLVLFQNETDHQFFIQENMYRNASVVLAGSGVNLDRFPFETLPQEPLVFGYMGRILRLKGFDRFLTVAKTIHQRYPTVRFVAVGALEDELFLPLIKDYVDQGILTYHAYQEDVRDFIRSIHCLIFPSRSGEGIPNSILESAAMGRACIASNIAGCQDVVVEGVSGYLFEDEKSLLDKVEQFIHLDSNARQAMGLAAHARVEAHFSRTTVVKTYLDLVQARIE